MSPAPEPRNSRFLAVVLALIVALLGYLVFVHWWFVAPHAAIASQMDDLREQQQRFAGILAQKPLIEKRLAEVRAFEQNNQAFLVDADANSAFSDLTQRLRDPLRVAQGERELVHREPSLRCCTRFDAQSARHEADRSRAGRPD